jgi:hypothetical protein
MIKLSDEQRSRIDGLLISWNNVQGRLKRAEQISHNAIMPAVNELRYAGRLLVGALTNVRPSDENGLPSIEEGITSASQYLTNADNDISDALLYFFQARVDEINSRFGAAAVEAKHASYTKILADLELTRSLVIESRSNLSKRKVNYDKISKTLDHLIDQYFELTKTEVFMALEIEAYEKKARFLKTANRILAVCLVVAVVVVIFY